MAVKENQQGQLIYKKPLQGGQQHPNPEFYLRLVPDAYLSYRKDPNSVSLEQLAEVDEIFCSRSGSKDGIVERPSKGELMEAFGTSTFLTIVKFMLEHGKWQAYGHHEGVQYINESSRSK